MIIDHHDDLGAFLRQTNPELATSNFVKEASWGEKPEMLDRDFAVILVEPNGTEHKKLAMNDAGNTLASMVYLLTREHQLPESAVKLASYNLLNAAMHYGLYDAYGDSLLHHEKVGSAFDVLAVFADALSNKGIIDERRVAIKEAMTEGMGYNSNMKTVATTKPSMGQPPVGNTVATTAVQGAMPNLNTVKTASAPKTSYDLIKEAEFIWPDLDPVDRRKAALFLQKTAALEGASVPEKIAQYAGHELNPDFEMIMHRRLDYVRNPSLQQDYERFSKVAHVMDLADATETLYLLDEQAGLLDRYGTNLPDPVLSVYGCATKEAMWSWNHGGDYCTEAELIEVCADPVKRSQFQALFSEEICESFRKNPVKVFESRPLEQQIIIARLANTTSM